MTLIHAKVSLLHAKVSLLNTKASHLHTKVSLPHAKVSHLNTKVSHPHTKVSHLHTNVSYPHAKVSLLTGIVSNFFKISTAKITSMIIRKLSQKMIDSCPSSSVAKNFIFIGVPNEAAASPKDNEKKLSTDYTDYTDFLIFFIICVNLCNLWTYFHSSSS